MVPEDNNYMNIIINPALAFGTGHHETTFLMIEEIIKKDLVNKTVIDIGTGSGILSILAKKWMQNQFMQLIMTY